MTKPLPLLLFAALACSACGRSPEPKPDLEKLDALVASLEAAGAEAGKADRLVAAVEKIDPDRIDPKLAIAAVAK